MCKHDQESCPYGDMLAQIARDTSDIKRELKGNGKIGLTAKVLIMWRSSLWVIGVVASALVALTAAIIARV